MLNKEARDWFGDQYKVLLDQGIEGFWNDMNEPSIFYAEDRLADALKEIAEMQDGEQTSPILRILCWTCPPIRRTTRSFIIP